MAAEGLQLRFYIANTNTKFQVDGVVLSSTGLQLKEMVLKQLPEDVDENLRRLDGFRLICMGKAVRDATRLQGERSERTNQRRQARDARYPSVGLVVPTGPGGAQWDDREPWVCFVSHSASCGCVVSAVILCVSCCFVLFVSVSLVLLAARRQT